jgi:hypothetical protein
MTTSFSISEQLRRQSVVPVESTIPPEMTIEQWRSGRRAGRRWWWPASRRLRPCNAEPV